MPNLSRLDPADPRLPERLWRWAVRRLSMGGEHTRHVGQRRKITQANMAALMAMAATWLTCVLFWINGNAALVRGAWLNLPFVFLYPLVWWLNSRGKSYFASLALFVISLTEILVATVFVQGTQLYVHYYLLAFAVMAPIIFAAHQWRSAIFVFCFNLALFVYFDTNGVSALPALAQIDPGSRALIGKGAVGGVLAILVAMLSISEYSAAISEWRQQQLASSDLLTGLPNRLALREAFASEMARRRRGASPMSFAMVDIDFFKRVNDEWGHEAGDQALCHVAGILRAQVRAGELVARMGGEEFGIILLAGPEHAQLAVQRMCRAVEAAAFTYDGKTRTITISIGLAHLGEADDQPSALRRADAALYLAKQQGRNQVVVA
jgi:diguanylate cyclase (GGDEF)-like protein